MVKTLLNWLRRSLENPSVPLSAGATSLDSTWAESSVHVSQGTALGLSGFWRGINLVSAYVAKTDLRLMRVEVEEGFVGRKPATRHSVYPLMLFEPNDETTAYYFKNALQSHA
nr:hypothetical protein [Burkholderiales bacterium]